MFRATDRLDIRRYSLSCMKGPPNDIALRLAALFAHSPAWHEAASHLSDEVESRVLFEHLPGQEWTLGRVDGATRLVRGVCADPDFVLRFTPGSVQVLEDVGGGIGEFAAALLGLVVSENPERRVEVWIVASFARLAARGYVKLLLAGGPKLLASGADRGVADIRSIARAVGEWRNEEPPPLGE